MPTRFRNLPLLILAALSVPASAQDLANERLTLQGELAPGQLSVTKTGTVYALKYRGLNDGLEYQIDVSDPNVSGGMLRVREKYSDSYPIAKGGAIFRDINNHLYLPTTLASYSVLTNQYISGPSVVLEYTDSPYNSGVHHRRHTFTLKGKVLSITIEDTDHNTAYLSNYSGMYIGPTQGTEDARLVQMQGTLAAPVILFENGAAHWLLGATMDLCQSNASNWFIPDPATLPSGNDSIDFSSNTVACYKRNSAGQISAPMKETWNVAVSRKLADVLLYPTQEPSPYRELLAHRTVLLLSAGATTWNAYKTYLQLLNSWGLDDIAAYCFSYWSASLIDPPSLANQGPDWFPAKDATNFTSLAATARSFGDLLAVYTSFSTMPVTASSSVYNTGHIARTDTGQYKNSYQLGTPSLGTTASGIHARREALSLKQNYGLNAAYLDIQTYATPSRGANGDHLDQTAGSPWAQTLHDAIVDEKTWMRDSTDIYQGPMFGESSIATFDSNAEWMWGGYCDSTQRVINAGGGLAASDQPLNDPHSPTLWPVIPEFELRVMSRLQASHGNGLYDRFFSRSDTGMTYSTGQPIYPLSEAALDRYRLYELTYGHTSYFVTTGPYNLNGNMIRYADMLKEYYLVRALQTRYLESPVATIQYVYQGALWNFEHILFQTETTDTFRNPQMRITFENGLEMYLNHSTTNWVVTVGGVLYTIPEDGFVATQPTTSFVAFSAVPPTTGGHRIDYCFAPGEYEFFDGRNFVNAYGNIDTNNLRRVKVDNFVRGLSVKELGNATIEVTNGIAPSVTSIDIVGSTDIVPGDRKATRAIAHYNNGAFRDVTSLVDWSSSNSAVATINEGGALIGATAGQTAISTTNFQGVASTPLTVVVH